MQKFSINHFEPNIENQFGSGLWGDVYDLHDETVVKIARDKSSGIGSGRKKIETEAFVLNALMMQGFPLSPIFIDKRRYPSKSSIISTGLLALA